MPDMNLLPDEASAMRHFNIGAERLLQAAGAAAALAGLLAVARTASPQAEDWSAHHHLSGPTPPAFVHEVGGEYAWEVGEGAIFIANGLGIYAVGRRHKVNRQGEEASPKAPLWYFLSRG